MTVARAGDPVRATVVGNGSGRGRPEHLFS